MDRVARIFSAYPEFDAPLLITKPENVRYFCGFTGEGVCLLRPEGSVLVTDFRYTEQAEAQIKAASAHFSVREITKEKRHNAILFDVLRDWCVDHIFYESDEVTVDRYTAMEREFEGIAMHSLGDAGECMRQIKDDAEIDCIRRAAALTDASFTHILSFLRTGVTEMDIKVELDYYFAKHGAGVAFPAIVASGPNGSMPHAEPGTRALQAGDLVTLDYGSKVDGYCSDFTRTVAIGAISEELQKIYSIVQLAQQKALEAVKPGMLGKEVDAVARQVISDAGYGEHFGHGTGHGVGLMIHEMPSLGQSSENVLKPSMVITIEPGIYLPGVGGVRIEDLVLVTENGFETLSRSTKELLTVQ